MSLWQKLLARFPTIAKGLSGAGPTVDWTQGNTQTLTLNAATVTPTFVAPPSGADLKLLLTQDGTGGRDVVWPVSVTWIGSGPPALFAAAGAVTEILFYFDGTTYFGSVVTASIPDGAIPWTRDILPADSPFTPSASQRYVAVNTSTGAVHVKTPLAPDGVSLPKDGQEFVVKCTAASATPCTVDAQGAGVAIEDPSNGGTTGASGAIQAVAGGSARFKYRASDKKWFVWASF